MVHIVRWIDYGMGLLVETLENGGHIKGEWFNVDSDGYNYWKTQPVYTKWEEQNND
jgi:hypothetical protein